MMTIEQEKNGEVLTLKPIGRLDTVTSPALEDAVKSGIVGITELILDFSGLEYVSSAGLRVLLAAQKIMNRQGRMRVIHANSDVKEIFDITGFSSILTVED